MQILSFFFGFFMLAPSLSISQKVEYDKVDTRRIAIYLPEGYEESEELFKTVYFYDGQASFGKHPYSWKINDKLTELIKAGKIEKVVAVGIYTDMNRTDDLLPYYDAFVAKNWGSYKARGDQFGDFIIKMIIPHIESTYKVEKKAESRALIGMSFAGLHAVYTGINNPEFFEMVAGISPSFWVDNYHIFKDLKKAEEGPVIWFDIGTAEWNDYTPAIEALTETGYIYGNTLFYYEEPDAAHDAKFWVKRIEYPLILFAGEVNGEIINIKSVVEVIPGADSKKHYLRVNPIATRKDGVIFSLGKEATYQVLNKEAGRITSNGSFEFINNSNLNVKISYGDWMEEITILYSEVKAKMKN